MTATATGGTSGVDAVTETQYSIPPVQALTDGSNYFDVAVSSSSFSQVVVADCNAVTASSVLYWWDPSAFGGFGGWDEVNSDNPPLGNPVYNSPCLTATFDGSSTPTAAQPLVRSLLRHQSQVGPSTAPKVLMRLPDHYLGRPCQRWDRRPPRLERLGNCLVACIL